PNPVWTDLVAFEIHGELDVPRFQEAWQQVIARHETLRTGFARTGYAFERLIYEDAQLPWVENDWRSLSAAERSERLARFRNDCLNRSFSLAEPPLLGSALIRMTDETHYWCLWSHHAVIDGSSYLVTIREALVFYEALKNGRPPRMRRPRQIGDLERWVSSAPLTSAESYWKKELGDPPL